MSGALPYMPWWRSNWRGEPTLRLVSYAACGLWRDMLDLAFDADPYGFVLLNGVPPTPEQLAAIAVAKTTPDEVRALLAELEAAGVFSRNESGVIFCRRMVRDGRPRVGGKRKREPSPEAEESAEAPAASDAEPLGKQVDRLVEHYVAEMCATHGLKPHQVAVPVGANRKFVRELLRAASLDEVLRDVSEYVRLDDAFLRERAYPLRLLASRLGEIHMRQRRPRATVSLLRDVAEVAK